MSAHAGSGNAFAKASQGAPTGFGSGKTTSSGIFGVGLGGPFEGRPTTAGGLGGSAMGSTEKSPFGRGFAAGRAGTPAEVEMGSSSQQYAKPIFGSAFAPQTSAINTTGKNWSRLFCTQALMSNLPDDCLHLLIGRLRACDDETCCLAAELPSSSGFGTRSDESSLQKRAARFGSTLESPPPLEASPPFGERGTAAPGEAATEAEGDD